MTTTNTNSEFLIEFCFDLNYEIIVQFGQQNYKNSCSNRYRVRLKSVLLEGTFGRVYRGTYTEEEGGEEEVLVKTVTGNVHNSSVSTEISITV